MPERAAAGQREIHRLVVAEQRDGLGVVDAIRSVLETGRRQHHPFRPPAEHGERRHPLPGLEFGLVGCRAHDSGDLHAGNERRLESKLILAAQEQQVGEAHPGRTDIYHDGVLIADIGWIFYIGVVQPRWS